MPDVVEPAPLVTPAGEGEPAPVLGALPPVHPAERPATDPSEREVARSFLRGVAWTGVLKLAGQLVAWSSTVVVARLLSPTDYGIVGMATIFLGLLQAVSEFGIGTAVVTRREMPRATAEQLHTVSVLLGIVGTLVGIICAPAVAWFYRSRELPAVLAAMSFTFLIASFRSVPWALLQRELRFKRLAVYDAVQAIALAGASVGLAAAGFRYWTLVAAALLSATLSSAIALWLHPIRFARPHPGRLRGVLRFGSDVVLQRLAWYGYSNSDFLIAGRMLGSAQLGAYSLAYEISHIPSNKIGAMLFQLTTPVLGRLQHAHDALRRMFLRVNEALLIVVGPMCVGIAVVAPDFVPLVLGEQWRSMILPLQVLSAYAAVTVLLTVPSQTLLVTGHERFGTRYAFAQLLVMPVAFLIGARWGIGGLALAWPLVHPVLAAVLLRKVLSELRIPWAVFIRDVVWPGGSSCALMALGVWAARRAVPHRPTYGVLACEVALGAAIYVGSLLLLHGRQVREAVDAIRSLRTGPAA
ncbi:MAG TPA: lipopolysaccharide biosynthesis protein [Gemmatimonadaceae bacterium]|nr:lipopolysaccharide biosynthesis protein [Gemmatimonadaceae bacterium]